MKFLHRGRSRANLKGAPSGSPEGSTQPETVATHLALAGCLATITVSPRQTTDIRWKDGVCFANRQFNIV